MRIAALAALATAGALIVAGSAAALPVPGFTELVSQSSSGVEGDQDSELPAISADGRFVAFSSEATNLVSGDRNKNPDVFVRDRQTGTTTRVSVATGGAEANAGGTAPAISRDGRFVAFESSSDNLAPDTNFTGDIYLHDRQTGTTELISKAFDGGNANSSSFSPVLNADGRFVYY